MCPLRTKRPPRNPRRPFQREINLALFTTAKERRDAGDCAGTAKAQDRNERRHLRNRNRDLADVIYFGSSVRTAVTGSLSGKIGSTQLGGPGDDGEVTESLRAINRGVARIGPREVEQRGIICWRDQGWVLPGQSRREGPASRLQVRSGIEGAEIVDREEIARLHHFVDRHVRGVVPSEPARGCHGNAW